MKVTLSQIKSWFKKGMYPTESQFANTFDSFWHKDDTLPLSAIQNLMQILNDKASVSTLDSKADLNHEHEGYLRLQDIVGKQDKEDASLNTNSRTIVGAINELHSLLGLSIRRSYTLDFGTAGEMVQDVAMLGAGTITRVITRNVSRLFVTNAANVRQEVSLTDTPSIGVSDGDILTWEIERTTDDELACVGVLFELSSTN